MTGRETALNTEKQFLPKKTKCDVVQK